MSSFGLILNLLLGGLLVAALALGLRLDRRLKALREAQAGFIKAVAELDQASARTRDGLEQWREATDEARELLHDRIEKAKVQTQRLDKAIAEAVRTPDPQPAPPQADPIPAQLLETLKAVRRLEAKAEPQPEPRPFPASSRSRAMIDDDLFEAGPHAGAVDLQRNLAAALGRHQQ